MKAELLGGLRAVMEPDRADNRTIFTVIRDDQVQTALDAIDRIIDTGIGVLFSLVLSIVYPSALDKQGVHLNEALPDWQKSNKRPPAPAPADKP